MAIHLHPSSKAGDAFFEGLPPHLWRYRERTPSELLLALLFFLVFFGGALCGSLLGHRFLVGRQCSVVGAYGHLLAPTSLPR